VTSTRLKRILQERRHPSHDAAPFKYLAQQHRAGVASQPAGAAFDAIWLKVGDGP
jgi:hypothetical protein